MNKHNYLITTHLSNLLPNKSNIKKAIILGKWISNRRFLKFFSNIEVEEVGYHWSNKKKYETDYYYIEKLINHYSSYLGRLLNKNHKIKYNDKQWLIILGPWLKNFIPSVYDKFCSIDSLTSKKKVKFITFKYNQVDFIPQDTSEFQQIFLNSDLWNQYIFTEIIKFTKKIEIEYKSIKISINKPKYKINLFKTALIKIINQFSIFNKYFIYDFKSKKISNIIFQLLLGNFPSIYVREKINYKRPNIAIRDNLTSCLLISTNRSFEKFLNQIIFYNVPISIFEGFDQVNKLILNLNWPKNPKLIYSSNAFNNDDIFNIYVALKKFNNNVIFLIGQHGGHYGTCSWSHMDYFETKISDYFISWGWNSKKYKNIISLPSPYLSEIQKPKYKVEGDILILVQSTLRYSYHMFQYPVSSLYKDYELGILKFINHSSNLKFRLRIKYDHHGWDQVNNFKENSNIIEVEDFKTDFISSISRSKLCVITSNFTSLLEIISINHPFIILWCEDDYNFNTKSEKLFNELKKNNILFNDHEKASEHLRLIEENVTLWWNNKSIQKSVSKFKNYFCQNDKEWKNIWKKNFLKLLD